MGYPAMEDRALLLLLRDVHRHNGLLAHRLSREPVLGIKRTTDTGLSLYITSIEFAWCGEVPVESAGTGRHVGCRLWLGQREQ